jgi:membrane protein DedA with SNARE-associated domain
MELLTRDMAEPILAFLREHARWAPMILFGIMLLEGIIVTTFIFSGVVIILASGALIQGGILPYGPVFIGIFTGFWMGDTINFMMGHKGERWFRNLAMVRSRPQLVAKAEALLVKWDWMAIAASRFMGPSRPFVTFLAGVFQMRPMVFHLATIAATLLLTAGLLNAGMTGVQLWNSIKR